ncbi:MAG: hypothetical protein O2955_09600 [Planctomycetota bacterium]|nr:hypothetical protein [Planctomycetota bacterium]
MAAVTITRDMFLEDRVGKAFSDVVNDDGQPFDEILAFFSDESRQQRMEDAELHHDRPPLAGVIRELEAQPAVDQFLGEVHSRRSMRLRQAVGALVGMIMQKRGWNKTGRKGSLGVRGSKGDALSPYHNRGGLAFWFLRAERYTRAEGMPFRTVRERCKSQREVATETVTKTKTNGSVYVKSNGDKQ